MQTPFKQLLILGSLALLTACQGITPEPTQTTAPITNTPVLESTSTATPTVEWWPTMRPSVTPTPLPSGMILNEQLPPGEYIFYSQVEGTMANYSISLNAIPNDGTYRKQLLLVPGFFDFSMSFSGNKLAISDETDIIVFDLHTGQVNTINNQMNCDDFISFSPDGSNIVCRANIEEEYVQHQIYILNLDNENWTRLTNWDYELGHWFSWEIPSWSPDNKYIAYFNVVYPPTGGLTIDDGLYLTDISCLNDSSDCRAKTTGPFENKHLAWPRYAWSPDSKSIAYSDHNGIFVFNIENKRLQTISNVFASSIVWSPDGQLIAYTADNTDNAYVLNKNGGDPISLGITGKSLVAWLAIPTK